MRGKEVDKAESEEESTDKDNVDGDICYGDYVGDDGTEIVIPSYLLSPELRTFFSQSVMLDPCEMDTLLKIMNCMQITVTVAIPLMKILR